MKPEALIREAAERLRTEAGYIEWFSWPQAFGSTAGPGAIGGQTMTTFQVFAFREAGAMEGEMWCAGRWRRWRGTMGERW